jgi:hypothetical protein
MDLVSAFTGEMAPFEGHWGCASCGLEIEMAAGEALPRCPREDRGVTWEGLSAAPGTGVAAPSPLLERRWSDDGGREPLPQ